MPGLWDEAEPWDADETWDDLGSFVAVAPGGVLFPDIAIEFSPTTDPLADPVWEDITSHLRSFNIRRGRSQELDRSEAGTATIELDNHLGYFDPSKTDGPYYPNIRPMRRVRIRSFAASTWDPFTVGSSFVGGPDVLGGSSTSIDLFSGFIETWEQHWTPQPFPVPDATAVIRAVDAFKLLAMARGIPSTSGTSGLVVGALLDQIAWPIDERNLEAGALNVSTVAASGSNTPVLGVLQEIDASEGGIFFVARDGRVTFYGSDHIASNPPADDQIWGDATAERQYQTVTLVTDESVIWNDVTVSSPTTADFEATDTLSQGHYGVRPTSVSTVLLSAADMATRAFDYLARFSVPRQRITSLEVGVRDDVEWDDILSKDLLDRIVVRRTPLRGQTGIEQDSVIQGITIDSQSRFRWSVVWTLSGVPSPNLLTPNQSSLDADTSGWVAVTNCSLSTQTVGPRYGSGTLQMTATAAGTMSASTTPNTQIPVVVGKLYSAMAAFSTYPSADPGRACHVEIVWRNSGGTILSSSAGLVVTELGGPGWVNSAVTAMAPAGAAFATVLVVIANSGATSHYVDTIGFVEGEQTGWSVGTG